MGDTAAEAHRHLFAPDSDGLPPYLQNPSRNMNNGGSTGSSSSSSSSNINPNLGPQQPPSRSTTPSPSTPAMEAFMRPFFPGQPKSLSGIALRAFCLGATFAASLLSVAAALVLGDTPAWRVPFFLLALSAFHFLEFWTTARRNTMIANVDAFLLTANWPAYAVAHAAAFFECALVSVFFPRRAWLPPRLAPFFLALGLLMVAAGQLVRSAAMLHAGASFNHQVQLKKAASHQLVTSGVYALVRHPSYFGFFYWGLGTQIVLGNAFCFVAYAAVLWVFFSDRIRVEEKKLVEFFEEDYVNYRKRVGTLMPFIR